MSLKAFHVFFIAICLLLGIGLGVWGFGDWRETHDVSSLVWCLLGIALAVASVPYSFWFVRKLKKVSYL